MKRITLFSAFFLFCSYLVPNSFNIGIHPSYAEAPVIIKFATVAPEGSTWTNVLRDIDKELGEKSNGRLMLKIYAGGVQGDEKDVVRKMRIGQTHSAGFTGVGLGEILPEVRVFDLPFFFKKYEEIDFVRNKFRDIFAKKFEEKGYIFLGWTEVGFVHFYSNINIKSLNDLRSAKMWMWEGDPLAKALFSSINLSPIPLAITDVMTSLQTGLIDSIYVSPLGVIALQWFQKVKYMLDIPMADATGAILITKKQYDTLSSDLQELLKSTFDVHTSRLLEIIRRDNEDSLKVLKEAGVVLVSMDDKGVKEIEDAGEKVRNMLVGQLYSAELLQDIAAEIENFRNNVDKKTDEQ